MTPKQVTQFALSLPDAVEDHPFGDSPDIYKVGGRIFVLLVPDPNRPYISLKCEPNLAEALRRQYPSVTPGYHLNKKHWNSVALDKTIPNDELREMIVHSYEQVVAKLPRATRDRLLRELDQVASLDDLEKRESPGVPANG